MPFEVVGFEDVETDNGVKPALNLLAKYSSEDTTVWGADGSIKYSESTLRNYCTNTYQGELDTNFVNCLAKTKVQTYSRDGSTDVVYDKLFAPSMAQLGVTDTRYNAAQQAAIEGAAFTAYISSDDAKRVKPVISTGSTAIYWTRSLCSGYPNGFGRVNTTGTPANDNYSSDRRVVTACNLVGD